MTSSPSRRRVIATIRRMRSSSPMTRTARGLSGGLRIAHPTNLRRPVRRGPGPGRTVTASAVGVLEHLDAVDDVVLLGVFLEQCLVEVNAELLFDVGDGEALSDGAGDLDGGLSSGESGSLPVAATTGRGSTVVSSALAMVNASVVMTSSTSAERMTCSST